jgi:hypothetical protein
LVCSQCATARIFISEGGDRFIQTRFGVESDADLAFILNTKS